jgi:hypothetical protein
MKKCLLCSTLWQNYSHYQGFGQKFSPQSNPILLLYRYIKFFIHVRRKMGASYVTVQSYS